jgi:hypothetical protein
LTAVDKKFVDSSYRLNDLHELGPEFRANLEAIVLGLVISSRELSKQSAPDKLLRLSVQLPKLLKFVQRGPGTLDTTTWVKASMAAGGCFLDYAIRTADQFWLNEAENTFRQAITSCVTLAVLEKREPLIKAHINLSSTLIKKSQCLELKSAKVLLQEAITTLERVPAICEPESLPKKYEAGRLAGLGEAHFEFGKRNFGSKAIHHFEVAVESFQLGEVLSNENKFLYEGSICANNLVCALTLLTEHSESNKKTELFAASMEAFENAKFKYGEDANSTATIGALHTLIGQREAGKSSVELLDKALAFFERSSQLYWQRNNPYRFAILQYNIGATAMDLTRLPEANQVEEYSKRSEAAFRHSLVFLNRNDHQVEWARAKANLAKLLLERFERIPEEAKVFEIRKTIEYCSDEFQQILDIFSDQSSEDPVIVAKEGISQIRNILENFRPPRLELEEV